MGQMVLRYVSSNSLITDRDTNLVYLSDKLAQRKNFYEELTGILSRRSAAWQVLPGTNDIWAVDYMPVQVSKSRFVRFTYRPDYLTSTKKYAATITDTDKVCEVLGIEIIKSDIIIDGGNVIRGESWVIMTDKIFGENGNYKKSALLTRLEEYFNARIIIIPHEPGDFTGHADGMVRHYSGDTLLINRYASGDKVYFQQKLTKTLKEAGLNTISIPYNPYLNKHPDEAHGIYINFLQMKDLVVVPLFGLSEDEEVIRQFEQLYCGQTIETLHAREIAKDGGVLNCISWNVYRPRIAHVS